MALFVHKVGAGVHFMIRRTCFTLFIVGSLGAAAGCSSGDADELDFEASDGEVGQSEDEVRESISGPTVRSSTAEVWSIENSWTDISTVNGRKAGVAWTADSGLSWEQKYTAWVSSFTKTAGANYGQTIQFKTPYGKTMNGPVLECADVAVWLRMTFSAWYHLPFYLTGSYKGSSVYFGHFGVVRKDGNPVTGFTRFKSAYSNYESSWTPGQPWPKDANLRTKHVGADDSVAGVKVDGVPFVSGDGAGAYFDEMFLNKRAGYLMVLLDSYFGSMNMADGSNLFHIQPSATSAGDVLVERWQRNGIGHVLPVVSSRMMPSGKMRASVASGSMPRRQPYWESEAQSASYFRSEYAGGRGTSYDGAEYAKLGGGIRRWRTPVKQSGRWNNIVPVADRGVYIEDGNIEGIASRPETFGILLAEESPAAQRDAALATIASARETLRSKPASCSQRIRREDAFESLYEVMSKSFGKSAAQVDAQYRTLEDYVFAELEYTQSKTCCWNATTPAMATIILDYAKKEKAAADAAHVCRQPTAFRATGGGYNVFKAHAATLGRAAEWAEWSEGESCPQRNVTEDTLTDAGKTPLCK